MNHRFSSLSVVRFYTVLCAYVFVSKQVTENALERQSQCCAAPTTIEHA